MKKFCRLFLCVVLLAQQSCVKDSCRKAYKLYTPVYKSLRQARADMHSTAPQPLQATGKLNVFGNTVFLNEKGRGIHVIDNGNPQAPKNLGFIAIPGNLNMAVKGSYLYADSYSDVVVFDISNASAVVPVKFLDNVMKEKNVYWNTRGSNNLDSISVVVDYTSRDTVVDCTTYERLMKTQNNCTNCSLTTVPNFFAAASTPTGTGGSMAGFTIVNDYLYTVGSSSLYCLNISNPANPQQTAVQNMGWGIETIYPFQNKLFIGSRTGMFIYDISNPASPAAQGQFSHVRVCDPVIADGDYAYVTLRGGNSFCGGNLNELDVLDVTNLASPQLKKTYSLSNPYGLAKDGKLLFICDGIEGLKLYDASSPSNIRLIKQISGLQTYDVIAVNGHAVVVATDGLYQYAYSPSGNMVPLSKLSVSKQRQ